MRYIYIILLFFSFAGYSQSVHVDGPTGRISDLPAVTIPAATDLVIIERNDSSKKVTFTNFVKMPHGMVSFHDSSTELTMSTGEWSHVTNAWNTLFAETDVTRLTFAGDSITIDVGSAGDYMINIGVSFSGTSGDNYEISLFKNHAQVGPITERTTGQTDVGYMGLPTYVPDLVAGDDLKLMIRNTASNDDATVIAVAWTIFRLHL